MNYQGIIITGTSGSGKTTITRELCKQQKAYALVQAITTRKHRDDDEKGEYIYLSEEEFSKLDKDRDLLIKSKYRSDYYGVTNTAFHEVIGKQQIPILVVTPESVANLEEFNKTKGLYEKLLFLTIFLDASDKALDDRLINRGEKTTKNITDQRQTDRNYEKSCIYFVINNDISKTIELIVNLWEFRNNSGILPKNLINLMLNCGLLLENPNPENISGASYDLTLADDHYYGGKSVTLTEQQPFLKIEPFEFAFVRSNEKFNLPRDVAARFDISVSLFFQGLIMSNGPQVDPGWRGGLWCLLFNTSNDTIQIKRGRHYATIEFHKLLHPTDAYKGQYQDKEKIADYLPGMASRSPINKIQEDIKNLKLEKWYIKILPILVAFTALLITLLAVTGVIGNK